VAAVLNAMQTPQHASSYSLPLAQSRIEPILSRVLQVHERYR